LSINTIDLVYALLHTYITFDLHNAIYNHRYINIIILLAYNIIILRVLCNSSC